MLRGPGAARDDEDATGSSPSRPAPLSSAGADDAAADDESSVREAERARLDEVAADSDEPARDERPVVWRGATAREADEACAFWADMT